MYDSEYPAHINDESGEIVNDDNLGRQSGLNFE